MADKILTSAAFIGFVLLRLIPLWMVIIIIFRDILITLLRAYADYKDFSFPTSYYAKWKTFLQMTFLYYLLIVYVGYNSFPVFINDKNIFEILLNKNVVYFGMLIITAITFHSGVTYVYKNRLLIKKLLSRET